MRSLILDFFDSDFLQSRPILVGFIIGLFWITVTPAVLLMVWWGLYGFLQWFGLLLQMPLSIATGASVVFSSVTTLVVALIAIAVAMVD